MTSFMICAAVVAFIILLGNFWLAQLENRDRNGGLIEPHNRYTILGIFKETVKEKIQKVKAKRMRKE